MAVANSTRRRREHEHAFAFFYAFSNYFHMSFFFQTMSQVRARFRVRIRSEEVFDVLAPSDRDPGELSTYQTCRNNDAWKINIKLIKTLIKSFRAIIL